jgi:hypothetical protein
MGQHVYPVLHHRFKIPMYKTQKGCMGKDVGPTREFAASPGVGPGATVGAPKTGYPHVQALSQDERACPRVPWLWLLSPGSGELQSRYMPRGSSSYH